MLSVKEISQRLGDRSLKIVSKATRVHVNTIAKIRDNPKANPTARVLEKLTKYLEKNQ